MAWYDTAVFYHIYPLGLCGCAHENDGQPTPGAFAKLNAWAEHASKDLGCTAIYIGPLFESGSHGYDTIDYRRVDRRLGTNEEFREFVANCHARGQKVIVDGVFNHVGRDFFAFKDLQANRENARYKDWFCDVNFWGNNEYNDGFSYGNWGGFNLLVKLNQRNPEVQAYHYDTIRCWVNEFDIDGIRLDAADVLDFDFMRGLRRLANEIKPEFWLMGEVIHGDYSRWANPEMLHSVTNYECYKGLYSSFNSMNMFEIAHSLNRQYGPEQWCIYRGKHLMTFADNHDVTRLASILKNKQHIRIAYGILLGMPGIPCLYYGSEWGEEGMKAPDNDYALRPCFEEPKPNELTDWLCHLISLRQKSDALCNGDYRNIVIQNHQLIFERKTDNERILVAVNASEQEYTAYHGDLNGTGTELITDAELTLNGALTLPPYSVQYIRF